WIEGFRVDLEGRAELLGCIIKPHQLQVLGAEIVVSLEIVRIDRQGLLKELDSLGYLSFAGQTDGCLVLTLCGVGKALVNVSRGNDAAWSPMFVCGALFAKGDCDGHADAARQQNLFGH